MLDRSDLPTAVALLPCEAIYIDPVSQMKSILGILTVRRVDAFPFTLSLVVYFSLTGRAGPARLTVRLLDPARPLAPLIDRTSDATFPDERSVVDLLIGRETVVIPAAGTYDLVGLVDDQAVIRRPIHFAPSLRLLATTLS